MGIEEIARYGNMAEKGEYIQLKGYPCINGACTFCTFPKDNTYDIAQAIDLNRKIIDLIEGKSGLLEVYNFGSIFELPMPTLFYLRNKAEDLGIRQIMTDSHWHYRHSFQDLREFLPGKVIIKIGLETFDEHVREDLMGKNMGTVTPDEILKFTDSVNLLVGFRGQTREQIAQDISIVKEKFTFADVNIIDRRFTRPELVDSQLVEWFKDEYRTLPEKFRLNYQVS
jgi:hypothetical protein